LLCKASPWQACTPQVKRGVKSGGTGYHMKRYRQFHRTKLKRRASAATGSTLCSSDMAGSRSFAVVLLGRRAALERIQTKGNRPAPRQETLGDGDIFAALSAGNTAARGRPRSKTSKRPATAVPVSCWGCLATAGAGPKRARPNAKRCHIETASDLDADVPAIYRGNRQVSRRFTLCKIDIFARQLKRRLAFWKNLRSPGGSRPAVARAKSSSR